MESVMWALKQLWEKGLLYEDYRVLPYDLRDMLRTFVPEPPPLTRASATKATRNTTGSMPKCSPRPPQTPARYRSTLLRVSGGVVARLVSFTTASCAHRRVVHIRAGP